MTLASIAEIAALMGDPARAHMLYALRDEGPLSAGELAGIGGVAASTASEHLARLAVAGLVEVERLGRRRYFRLASPELTDLLDGLEVVAGRARAVRPEHYRVDEALLHVRRCYDHLSGRVGVQVTMSLYEKGYLAHGAEGPEISAGGRAFLADFGVALERGDRMDRCQVRLCHDWQRRNVHLGGAVAGGLFSAMVARDWMRRGRDAESVRITPAGIAGLRQSFGIDLRSG